MIVHICFFSGIMAKVLDYSLEGCKFKLQLHYCVYFVTSFLSCLDDIVDILVYLVPDTSTTKYVNKQKFIIRPIYLDWLVRLTDNYNKKMVSTTG